MDPMPHLVSLSGIPGRRWWSWQCVCGALDIHLTVDGAFRAMWNVGGHEASRLIQEKLALVPAVSKDSTDE